jgi:hypothetical protein
MSEDSLGLTREEIKTTSTKKDKTRSAALIIDSQLARRALDQSFGIPQQVPGRRRSTTLRWKRSAASGSESTPEHAICRLH